MSQLRIAARCVSSLGGGDTSSSTHNGTDADIMHDDVHSQQEISGNRCGHYVHVPRLAKIPMKHKRRFPVIEQAKENLLSCYHHPLRYRIGVLFYHQGKTRKQGLYRKRRSEIREALTTLVGYAILHCVNLANMALGKILPNGSFSPFDITYLSKLAGVTISQTRRALRVFQDCGYITLIERKYVLPNGDFRSEAPIINVSPDLFIHLEIPESDLKAYQTKQEAKEKKEQTEFKSAEYNKKNRESRKAQKIAMRNIREIIAKAKAGNRLSDDERKLLDREMPGYSRQLERSVTSSYRDYTGCSQGIEQPIYRNKPLTAANFLKMAADKALEELDET